jgi:hypothetical protein
MLGTALRTTTLATHPQHQVPKGLRRDAVHQDIRLVAAIHSGLPDV